MADARRQSPSQRKGGEGGGRSAGAARRADFAGSGIGAPKFCNPFALSLSKGRSFFAMLKGRAVLRQAQHEREKGAVLAAPRSEQYDRRAAQAHGGADQIPAVGLRALDRPQDRKSTRLNSSH